MPTHGNLRHAYTLATRKFLLNDADMHGFSKPFLDRIQPDEYSIRRKDNSLFGKVLDDTLRAAVTEIDRCSELTDFAKGVIRVLFTPILREKTSPDVELVEKAMEAAVLFEDEGTNADSLAGAVNEPIVEIPDEGERSLFTDVVSVGKAVCDSVPQLQTIKDAVHVAGAVKRTYDRVRSGSSKAKTPKKLTPSVMNLSQLSKVANYEHDSQLGEFLGEDGTCLSPSASLYRQNMWDMHSSETCAACKHIADRSWPKMNTRPAGKRLKALAFFHAALSNGMSDVFFEFERVKGRADHWYNTSEVLTRDLLEEGNLMGVSDRWE